MIRISYISDYGEIIKLNFGENIKPMARYLLRFLYHDHIHTRTPIYRLKRY